MGSGHFPSARGSLQDLSSSPGLILGSGLQYLDVAPMPKATFSAGKWVSPAAHYLSVPRVTRPTFVLWVYDSFVFREYLAIGSGLNVSKLNGFDSDGHGESYSLRSVDRHRANGAPPSVSIVEGAPPGTTVDNAVVWDRVSQRLLPLRPGRYMASFPTVGSGTSPIYVEISAGFPGDRLAALLTSPSDAFERSYRFPILDDRRAGAYLLAHFRHIAGAPGVRLDPVPDDGFTFQRLAFFEPRSAPVNALTPGGAGVENGVYTNNVPGRSVLVFSRSHYRELPDGKLDGTQLLNPASFPAAAIGLEPLFGARSRPAAQRVPDGRFLRNSMAATSRCRFLPALFRILAEDPLLHLLGMVPNRAWWKWCHFAVASGSHPRPLLTPGRAMSQHFTLIRAICGLKCSGARAPSRRVVRRHW